MRMRDMKKIENPVVVVYLLILTNLMTYIEVSESCEYSSTKLSRSSFPAGFLFGAGSSAYQYEGAANVDGRGPSIWDTFVVEQADKIADHSTGNAADEFYYRYKKDIARLKKIGLDTFKLSISWPRLLPQGKISGVINWRGVEFYNFLIDELLSNGIQPVITLFHWDLPQALEDEYGGFLSPRIVNDFVDYVDFCFKEFGDKVKYWITANEVNLFSEYGYANGEYAPGRCSSYIGNCSAGNSATEPYLVTHHLILCHATAVKLYREKYQDSQNGIIGVTVNVRWLVPKYETVSCRSAASRGLDFQVGWVIHPMVYGDYPLTMRYLVGKRLPKFTKAQSLLVKGSLDFIGVNYYTARYAEDSESYSTIYLSYTTDSHVNTSANKNGIPIGEPTTVNWIYIYPEGLRDLLLYVKRKYEDIPIYVTENGMGDNNSVLVTDFLNDSLRIKYHRLHLSCTLQAIKDGVDVRGYSIWSFLDDFEWALGYTVRFGITFVDYKNGLQRYLKHSAFWFKSFLQRENATLESPLLLSE